MDRGIDLSGQKFGRLLAVKIIGAIQYHRVWECVCDCGRTVNVTCGRLRSGRTKSCGCLKKEVLCKGRSRRPYAPRAIDITGKKFGLLTAVSPTLRRESKSVIWKVYCECGNMFEAPANRLIYGNVKSCGCLSKISTKKYMLSDRGTRSTAVACLVSRSPIGVKDLPDDLIEMKTALIMLNRCIKNRR